MKLLGMHVDRPREGQWLAAFGLAATLVGMQVEYMVYEWFGPTIQDFGTHETRRDTFINGEAWAGWYSYAIVAMVAISLVAALLGATLVSLSGSMLALGVVVVIPLPILNYDAMYSYRSPYTYGLGYFVMATGLALAAYGSSIDVRRRLARDPSPEA